MNITQIENAADLVPLKFAAHEVPHAVIETNENCNRKCVMCYKRHSALVKPLGQIRAEVDLAVRLRKLETISLLGGEPTLHPALPDVIRYIKTRGLVCQVLSNGLRLVQPGGDELLDRLIAAGLDRIVLHVDEGQGMDDAEMQRMRDDLASLCEGRRILFGFSITLSSSYPDVIPGIMKRFARFRYFDGILATVASHMERVLTGVDPTDGSPAVFDVYAGIRKGLAVLPSAYLPSNIDDDEIRWLTYFYYLNAATGAAFGVSPWFGRLMRKGYRVLAGRHLFAAAMRPWLMIPWFGVTALLELLRAPRRLGELVRLLRRSRLLSAVRFQYIVVQVAPTFNLEKGRVEICYHCPDATIRHGALVPVCLADWLPRAGNGGGEQAEAVYRHLVEA
jgi:hypothetical protein